MQRVSPKLRGYRKVLAHRKEKKLAKNAQLRAAKKARRVGYLRRNRDRFTQILLRNNARDLLYKRRILQDGVGTVIVDGQIGLEEDEGFFSFLDVAEKCINSPFAALTLDFSKCTRMWPSAVTLFCSLKEWVTLARFGDSPQRVGSTLPEDKRVESYLWESGFYKFVNVDKSLSKAPRYSGAAVVKIEQKTERSNIRYQEDQVMDLLRENTSWNEDQLTTFDSVILAEIMINITEHGINHRREGWWLLAQHHPKHKIISLCFADNGIGIRHSLVTGPQREAIQKRYLSSKENDGEYIKMATDPTISGAISARVLPGKKEGPGADRGRGLNVLLKASAELGVKVNILSHYGYVAWNADGSERYRGVRKRRIFAGTMYHLVVDCR